MAKSRIQVACRGNPNQCMMNGQGQLECGGPVQSTRMFKANMNTDTAIVMHTLCSSITQRLRSFFCQEASFVLVVIKMCYRPASQRLPGRAILCNSSYVH